MLLLPHRYSFTVSPPEVQYGNDPLIIPPFNWGDKPDRAYTSDGGELGKYIFIYKEEPFLLLRAVQRYPGVLDAGAAAAGAAQHERDGGERGED